MIAALFALVLLGALLWALERNHRRQRPRGLYGSADRADRADRDAERVEQEMRFGGAGTVDACPRSSNSTATP